MSQPPNAFSVVAVDGCVVVTGEVDAQYADALQAEIAAVSTAVPVRIDLSAVTFMDSSGLRALIESNKRCSESGQSLSIVNPSPPVMRVIEITGLTTLLHTESV